MLVVKVLAFLFAVSLEISSGSHVPCKYSLFLFFSVYLEVTIFIGEHLWDTLENPG